MEEELKRKMEQAIWSAKSLFERRKAAGSAANISFSHRDRIYISASGVCFGDLSMDSFAVMDREGGHLGGPKPSKEFPLHRLLYIRKGVGAVLHTHSFYAVLWSCLRHENMHDVIPAHTPYLRMKVGKVGMVPYALPGSDELFALFEKYIDKSDGYLLANHGPVVGKENILETFYGMEELEENAKLAWYLRGKNCSVNIGIR